MRASAKYTGNCSAAPSRAQLRWACKHKNLVLDKHKNIQAWQYTSAVINRLGLAMDTLYHKSTSCKNIRYVSTKNLFVLLHQRPFTVSKGSIPFFKFTLIHFHFLFTLDLPQWSWLQRQTCVAMTIWDHGVDIWGPIWECCCFTQWPMSQFSAC